MCSIMLHGQASNVLSSASYSTVGDWNQITIPIDGANHCILVSQDVDLIIAVRECNHGS